MINKKFNVIFLLIAIFSLSVFSQRLTFPVDFKVTPKSASASSAEKKHDLKKSFDGKENTYYLSGQSSLPVTLTYNFSGTEKIDYIQYIAPSLQDNAGKITELELWYTLQDGNRTKFNDLKLNETADFSRITFPVSLQKVSKIEFIIKSATNNTVGVAEMEFYKANPEKITPSSGYASNYQRGEGIENSFDNDINTIYHSSWSNTKFPVTLRYNFDNTDQIDYLVCNPRQDATNGLIKEFEVWYTTKTQKRTKLGDFDFKGSSSPGRITFPEPLVNPVSIEFVVKSGVGDNTIGFVSCAEMEFFRNYPANSFDLSTVFADKLCSALKTGITEKDIRKIPNLSIRKLALDMLKGNYSSEFRIASYKPYQHPDIMAKANKTNPYSLRDNPTGISVKQGEELVVFADNLNGQSISILVQNLDKGFGGKSYGLVDGVNIFTVDDDGLAYLTYLTETGTEQPVNIHIASGSVNGYFDSRKHSAQDWKRLIDNATDKYFDVLGKSSHLTFNTEDFRKYTTDGLALINAYDRMVEMEQDFMGLNKYNKQFKNRMYFHTVYGNAYMYATSYRTAYHQGTLKELCNVDRFTTTAIWGPAHEVGHCNQTRPGLKWQGMTEVTNNIYSLYIQTSFGNPSRLMGEKMRDYGNRYNKALQTIVEKGIPHNQADDVFCKLVPFWQLKLYVHDVLGNDDFYKDIHEKVRVTPDPKTEGECQLQFVKFACEASNLDLTDFFKKWGFLTPVNTVIDDYSRRQFEVTQAQIDALLKEIKAMKLPKPKHANIHEINDNNVKEYKL
ncbi:hypothetical protein D0T49_06695 [Paludibacter sp. 221]|uniref:M60 family metallopeptidase n=1 Tax=Paludibacter sp. 221 TaxID=2302939 RepID=UPI0013D380DD|nr:M60 family metallopeptidase [Paludibacter sp. 221]NDV46733.1 hypothetical protein [Paludibacter sp. 221]